MHNCHIQHIMQQFRLVSFLLASRQSIAQMFIGKYKPHSLSEVEQSSIKLRSNFTDYVSHIICILLLFYYYLLQNISADSRWVNAMTMYVREKLVHNVASFRQVTCYNYRCVIDITEAEMLQFSFHLISIRHSEMNPPPTRCCKLLSHYHHSEHSTQCMQRTVTLDYCALYKYSYLLN